MFKGIAELFTDMINLFSGDFIETGPENVFDLSQDLLVSRKNVIIDSPDTKHGITSFGLRFRYEKSVNVRVELETVGPEDRLPPKIEMALYRIVQEALTNIARHAQAHTVHVYLARGETRLAAVIEDDGQGFPVEKVLSPQMPDGGTGLLGMRERVTLLCGDFDIQSTVGQGTRITIKIPLEAGCGGH